MFTEILLHATVKTDDDRGGYTAALAAGTIMWGIVQIHEGEPQLVARREESISPEDIIEVDGQYYRVLSKVGHLRGPYTTYGLEATTKPIVP